MEPNNNSTKNNFDNLYTQLVATLEQEAELRSKPNTPLALIEVKARLHTLRSELALARTQLTPATNQRADELNRPQPRRRSPHHSPDSTTRPTNKPDQLIPGPNHSQAETSHALSSSGRP